MKVLDSKRGFIRGASEGALVFEVSGIVEEVIVAGGKIWREVEVRGDEVCVREVFS